MGIQSRYDSLQGMEYHSDESKAIRRAFGEGAAESYGHHWVICVLGETYMEAEIDSHFGPGAMKNAWETQALFQATLKKTRSILKAAKAAGYTG